MLSETKKNVQDEVDGQVLLIHVWSGEAVSSYAHLSITSEPVHRFRDATTSLGSLKTCFGDGPIQGPSMVTDISDRTRVTWHDDTITQRLRAQRTYAHASLPPSPSTPIAGRRHVHTGKVQVTSNRSVLA